MSTEPNQLPEPIDLFVCVTCQRAGSDAGAERPGTTLYRKLEKIMEQRAYPHAIRLHPVECLAVCKRPCTVAVSAPAKWTYIIGDLDAQLHTDALLEYLDAYAASASGTPSLKQRPAAIRSGTIARIPPSLT